MIPLPQHHFQVFHRYLPNFEILVTGMKDNHECFFVSLQAAGADYCFGYEIPDGEIVAASFHNILIMSAKMIAHCITEEKKILAARYGDYHVRH